MQHPKKERTFVIIKPDGIQRGLMGEIIKRYERTGLKLVGIKFGILDEKKVWVHYNKDDAWFLKKGTKIVEDKKANNLPVDKEAIEYGKDIIKQLAKFMTSGPTLSMVWEGNQAVAVVTKITGTTEPATSDVGTIRGDLTVDSYTIAAVDDRAVRNLIHCSESPEEAQREIGIWFTEGDMTEYRHLAEEILYDVNLDGILE
ncbi:MAG: putative Nucleoside diphosphate kinase [Candidatus Kaiserbacteria bacterium]|nr:putative Nucleoside diphosphate kinase [Candidatus Kaiserbacteria bacterium]